MDELCSRCIKRPGIPRTQKMLGAKFTCLACDECWPGMAAVLGLCDKCGGTGEIYEGTAGYPRPCYPCLVGAAEEDTRGS